MDKQDRTKFLSLATNYCDLIDSFSCLDEESLDRLLASMLELYLEALKLPKVEPENTDKTHFVISVPDIHFGKYEFYWEIFDPFELEEPVKGSLSDDISDIYTNLKEGIFLYEQNMFNEAIWYWKFHFEAHWGSHLVDALRALHSIKTIQTKERWTL